MRVFIDSDVVISSLLSSSGAAYFLLNKSQIKPVISSVSIKELRIVAVKLGIKPEKVEMLIANRFEVHALKKELKEVKNEYMGYVTDVNDAHVVAGAHGAKVKYLISYNLKHFKIDKIKSDFNIILLTPALFLQYLRVC
jgi:predicted nucleic acid-binding protein